MPQINYTNEEKVFTVLKPGEYDVQIVEWEWGTSNGQKTAGAETLSVRLETEDSAPIFDTIIFAPSTGWKASALLRCFGKVFPEGQAVNVEDGLLSTLRGITGRVKLKVEKYTDKNGNEREANRVEFYITHKPAAAPAPGESLEIPDGDVPDAEPAKYPDTKEGAWAALLEYSNNDKAAATQLWKETVAAVAKKSGKNSTTQFGAAEWKEVKGAASVPF